jgi:hypothetical protein
VLDAAGFGHLEQVAAKCLDVAGGADRFEDGVEATGEPWILCGDAGGAAVGVALLGLDAAEGEHRFASDVDGVDAEREGDDGVVGEAELTDAVEDDAFVQVAFGEGAVDAGESVKMSGAAPVPPSPPSTVMKSTPR